MLKEMVATASSSRVSIVGDWRVKFPKVKTDSRQYLTITLSVVDSPDNIKVGEEVIKYWAAVGVKANLEKIATDDVADNVVKGRNFEVLLFSQILGGDPDEYSFWHSSQAGAGGLNIANYRNSDVDALLESARLATDAKQRITKYQKFQELVTNDLPVVFLYSPNYIYPQNKNIKGLALTHIVSSSDRLQDAYNWYINTTKKLKW
jgi:peptide/nickel transport system substrate-binding protein